MITFFPSSYSAPQLVLRHLMLLTYVSNRGRSQRGHFIKWVNYLKLVIFLSICAKLLILFLIPVLMIYLFLHYLFLVFIRYLKKRKKRLHPGPYLEQHIRMHFPVLVNFQIFCFEELICYGSSNTCLQIKFWPFAVIRYVVNTGTQDKTAAKRVRISHLMYLWSLYFVSCKCKTAIRITNYCPVSSCKVANVPLVFLHYRVLLNVDHQLCTTFLSAQNKIGLFSPFCWFTGIMIVYTSLFLIAVSQFFLQVDLLRGQKTDKVDVTLQPEELEVLENVVAAK